MLTNQEDDVDFSGTVDFHTDADVHDTDSIKCFLCDRSFVEGEGLLLLFEKRVREDGKSDSSLSAILSSALGHELGKGTAHSTLLCETCNLIVLEYESVEQRLFELRYRILNAYNRTAKRNNRDTIAIEVNGLLQHMTDTEGKDMIKSEITVEPEQESIVLLNENSLFNEDLPLASEMNGGIDSDADITSDLVEEINENDHEDVREDVATIEQQQHNDSSNYAFTVISMKDHTIIEEINKVKSDDEISMTDLQIDGQDIIIYDEIIEQENSQSSFSQEENNASQYEELYSSSLSGQADNLQLMEEQDKSQAKRSQRQQQLCERQDENTYICLLCEDRQELGDIKAFTKHINQVHNTPFFPCTHCGEGFTSRRDLQDHVDEEHRMHTAEGSSDLAIKIECETCQRVFTNQRLFHIHKRTHNSSTMKQYECTKCHKKYNTKNLLKVHMNMHNGERPYKCQQCPKDFASKYTLQTHTKIHSERERPFQCDKCDKAFLNHYTLMQHKKLHVNGKSFVCEICSKAFGTQHNLDVHQIVHSGQRPFICRICFKSFARRAEIKDHERIHTGERPYSCDICGISFAQRSNLTSHKKSTHFNEKLHKCDQCGRSFKRRRLLEYHNNAVHTGKRPHKCGICGSAFVYPEHLKKHSLIHAAHKPFACEVCGKEFSSRDNRNAHRFVHSEKKPYECLECGAGFMRKPMLLTHMNQTKHVNDTIIVNQPQISGYERLTLSNAEISTMESAASLDEADDDVIIRSQSSDEELLENLILHQNEIILPHPNATMENDDHYNKHTEEDIDNRDDDDDGGNVEVEDDDGTIRSVSGQLIKDQIGNVKYLQFEDLDKDGQQTFTWVDISDVKH